MLHNQLRIKQFEIMKIYLRYFGYINYENYLNISFNSKVYHIIDERNREKVQEYINRHTILNTPIHLHFNKSIIINKHNMGANFINCH